MVCCFFRFRDQEFLKPLIFAKNETKIRDLRTSKSLQSQKQQTISERLSSLFPRLSILKVKRNDIISRGQGSLFPE